MLKNDCVCLYVCMSMILFVYVHENDTVAMMDDDNFGQQKNFSKITKCENDFRIYQGR